MSKISPPVFVLMHDVTPWSALEVNRSTYVHYGGIGFTLKVQWHHATTPALPTPQLLLIYTLG